jgi:phage-related protein
LPNFFKKLASGAGNFFKKVDNGASNFFKKIPGTVNNIANQVVNPISNGVKKVGNFLEKNAGTLSAAGAGLADALGQPEIGLAITGAGLSAQNMGKRISNSSNTIQDFKTQGLNKVNVATNQLMQKQDQIRNQVNNTLTKVGNIGSTPMLQSDAVVADDTPITIH